MQDQIPQNLDRETRRTLIAVALLKALTALFRAVPTLVSLLHP